MYFEGVVGWSHHHLIKPTKEYTKCKKDSVTPTVAFMDKKTMSPRWYKKKRQEESLEILFVLFSDKTNTYFVKSFTIIYLLYLRNNKVSVPLSLSITANLDKGSHNPYFIPLK